MSKGNKIIQGIVVVVAVEGEKKLQQTKLHAATFSDDHIWKKKILQRWDLFVFRTEQIE